MPGAPQINKDTKFVLVSGGVCSSLGKGVTTSAIGALLRQYGFRVCSTKIDPYINVDAGLMSPFEHGEVFVLDDGGEADLDLGNYERWMAVHLSRHHNITTGKVYQSLIETERQGGFLGKTVQIVPHFTNEVIDRVMHNARITVDDTGLPPEICLIELGGTIGDMESAPFVEALRRMRFMIPRENFCQIHTTYLPEMGGSQKTKPTQHSCRSLLSCGLIPDFLVCRSREPLVDGMRVKLMEQCGVNAENIISAYDMNCLYNVPIEFEKQGLIPRLLQRLELGGQKRAPLNGVPSVETYQRFAEILSNPSSTVVNIAFVGKYVTGGSDAYFSVVQTFEHCCVTLGVKLNIVWVDSEDFEGSHRSEAEERLKKCDGIFVAGGFGIRGVDGKVSAVRVAREHNIPYFGVCLGMQIAMIESMRNVMGLADANSAEFDPNSKHQIVRIMDCDKKEMGATMHLGARDVHLVKPGSIMSKIYGGEKLIRERHRHRYEFNMEYAQKLSEAGLVITGVSDPSFGPTCRVEAIENPKLRFFLAVQYHPEFITTPMDPSPPYLAFMEAAAHKSHNWDKPCNPSRTKKMLFH